MSSRNAVFRQDMARRGESCRPYYNACIHNCCTAHFRHHPARALIPPLTRDRLGSTFPAPRQGSERATIRDDRASSYYTGYHEPGRARNSQHCRTLSQNAAEHDLRIPDVQNGRLSTNFQPYRDRGFFQVGSVFKALWPQPAGNSSRMDYTVITSLGELVHSKIQWFVVIQVEHNYSISLPIQTYGGRGAADKFDGFHSIVYTGHEIPQRLEAECGIDGPPMGEPIRVEPNAHWKYMKQASRINFRKFYTVEDYVKTYVFGRVHPDDMLKFVAQINSRGFVPRHEPPPPATRNLGCNIYNDRSVVDPPLNDIPLATGFSKPMLDPVSLDHNAAEQAVSEITNAGNTIDATQIGLQPLMTIEGPVNHISDVEFESTDMDSVNEGPTQYAVDEHQLPHTMHENSQSAVTNWALSRLAFTDVQQEFDEAEDFAIPDGVSPFTPHEEF